MFDNRKMVDTVADTIVEALFNHMFGLDEEDESEYSSEINEAVDKLGESLDNLIDLLKKDSMKKEKKELMPCPICGSSCHVGFQLKSDGGGYYITCNYCPMETIPAFETEDEAIDYWNDRRGE